LFFEEKYYTPPLSFFTHTIFKRKKSVFLLHFFFSL
jgi:hypothetical protein